MKKVALATIGCLVLVLGLTVPGQAINGTQSIKAKVTPKKHGTKKKPRNIKLDIETITAPAAGEAGTFAASHAVVWFDKNIVFNGKAFKTCSQAQVQSDDTQCPAGSKVGTGSADAELGSAGSTQKVHVDVTLFNGPGGKTVFLHVTGLNGAVNSVMIGKLIKVKGNKKYGSKLDVTIPTALQKPGPNLYSTLTDFQTHTGPKKSKGKPYVGLTGCPKNHKLKFAGDFNYTDNTSKHAETTAACK